MKKSHLRLRVWGGFCLIIIHIVMFNVYQSQSYDLLHWGWSVSGVIIAAITMTQKCEVCGLAWYVASYPDMNKGFLSFKSLFFPQNNRLNPLNLPKECPKCKTSRI